MHLLLLIFLAFFASGWSVHRGDLGSRVAVEINTSLDVRRDLFQSNAWTVEAEPMLRPPGGGPVRQSDHAIPGDPMRPSALKQAAGRDVAAVPEELLSVSGIASGSGLGVDDGVGGGGGEGVGSADFFGVAVQGKRFVYLIDRSTSMEENRAFQAAQKELIHSLERLSPAMEFQVVFYSDEPRPLDLGIDGMAPATARFRDKAVEQIKAMTPQGGTNHDKGIRYALGLRPDVLFVLTDADDMQEKVVTQLTGLNQKGRTARRRAATIHVIQFHHAEDRRPEKTIRLLAERNRGTYRLIQTKDLHGMR